MQLLLLCLRGFWPGRWHNQNLFKCTKCQKAARFGQKSNSKFVLQAQRNAYTIHNVYDTSAIRIRHVGRRKRVQTGSKAHEATRRLCLCLNIKSHAEESWFGTLWQRMVPGMAKLNSISASMFGFFWATTAP